MPEETQERFEQEEATSRHGHVERISAARVDMSQSVADIIHADKDVTIRQGGAKEVRAESVTIRQGAALTLDAEQAQVVQGAIGLVRSGQADLGPVAKSAAVIADAVHMQQSGTHFMLARDTVEMEQSGAVIMVARHVTARRSAAVLLFADTVEGDVNVMMDRQMAVTFGAALGTALGLILI